MTVTAKNQNAENAGWSQQGPPKQTGRQPQTLRALPADKGAEAAVLGSMIVDPRCIGDVVERLDKTAFYYGEHQTLFTAIVTLWQANQDGAVDGLLVRRQLEQENQLDAIGGPAYLQQVLDTVPTAVNAAYYAEIVQEAALLREVIAAGSGIVNDAYDGGDAKEILDAAEKRIFAVTNKRVQGKPEVMRTLVEKAFTGIQNREGGGLTGLTTGFFDLDSMTAGFQKGDMILLAARPSIGKAQPLDALVLTPAGFVPMGFIRVGTEIIGRDGETHAVTGVFPQGKKDVYRVEFNDGTSTECCEDHLWLTQTRNEKRFNYGWSMKSCREIMGTLRRPDGNSPNHRIPWVEPVSFLSEPSIARPIRPYLLGLWLGDGCGSATGRSSVVISNPEPDIQNAIALAVDRDDCVRVAADNISVRVRRRKRNNEPSRTEAGIRMLGLDRCRSFEKFIPHAYLHAPIEDRQDLLRGLLDTDGHVTGFGDCIEYCTSSPQLACDVVYLVRSLGGKARMRQKQPFYTYLGVKKMGRTSYRIHLHFRNGFVPVSSRKHLKRLKMRTRGGAKMIVAISPVGRKPCQCIAVDAPDGLYVTNDFIVTHNTSLAMNCIENVTVQQKLPAAVFSLEMSKDQLAERALCSYAGVNFQNIRKGTVTGADYDKLVEALGAVGQAPLFIDDTTGLTPLELRAKARRLKSQYDIRLVVIDYLQLMNVPGRRDMSPEEKTSEISRHIKSLARELNIPVIAISQLNRAAENREGHEPRMSDLRYSGSLEQDADVVLLLHREDYYHRGEEGYEPDRIAKLIVAKARNGPTGYIRLLFRDECVRFENLASSIGQESPWGRL